MKAKEWFTDLAKGASLGTGILPGVSVGTVGLIVSIYDKLIGAIASLRKRFVASFLTLLPIALGCLAAAVALLVFWQKLAAPYFPFVVVAGLAGFVAGAIPLLLVEFRGQRQDVKGIGRIVLGFVLAALIGLFSYLSAAGVIPGFDLQAAFDNPFGNVWVFPLVLVVGLVAGIGCLVPGISGSMILFIFGLYQPVVNLFISTETHPSIFHNTDLLLPGLLLALTLTVGAVIGLILVSKAMKSLLAKHRLGTYQCVVGFVLGSLLAMFVNNQMYEVYTNPNTNQWWQFVAGAVAFAVVCLLTIFAIKRQQKSAAAPQEELTNEPIQ
ncbi:MAG: DUF368 domain-containing protein [Bacilli bacterium]|nr:DUF368 domain-containing protein [Bacilli bacterium]